MNGPAMTATEDIIEYVTATIGGQLFGMPISRVRNVFIPDRTTRVPLAAPEVVGLLNLRGRIATATIRTWRSKSSAKASSMAS
jgi:purine-binding chemotaxis protein CheW